MFDVSKKIVLLTGASGHLGHALAMGLNRAGATTLLVGRDRERLAALKAQLSQPARGLIRAIDLSKNRDIEDLVYWVGQEFGRLHGLVNNAYAGRVGAIEDLNFNDFELATRLNLFAPFALARGLAPLMRKTSNEESSSSIVNIGSMYGKISPEPSVYEKGENNPAHYGATKAALLQLTRYLACNLDPARIRVNSVSPGPFPNLEKNSAEFVARLARKVPIKRIGRPEEFVGPVIFLLSDASSYVNGADIAVDGGWTAW